MTFLPSAAEGFVLKPALFDLLSWLIDFVLVQHRVRDLPLVIFDEGNLRVHNLKEKVHICFSEQLALSCPVAWPKNLSPSRVILMMKFCAS